MISARDQAPAGTALTECNALFDHLAAIDAADLNQHRRLKVEPALVVVLDTIAVLLRRESGCRPLAGIDTQPRTLDVLVIDDPLAVAGRDVVTARVVRNFDDFPEARSPASCGGRRSKKRSALCKSDGLGRLREVSTDDCEERSYVPAMK